MEAIHNGITMVTIETEKANLRNRLFSMGTEILKLPNICIFAIGF